MPVASSATPSTVPANPVCSLGFTVPAAVRLKNRIRGPAGGR